MRQQCTCAAVCTAAPFVRRRHGCEHVVPIAHTPAGCNTLEHNCGANRRWVRSTVCSRVVEIRRPSCVCVCIVCVCVVPMRESRRCCVRRVLWGCLLLSAGTLQGCVVSSDVWACVFVCVCVCVGSARVVCGFCAVVLRRRVVGLLSPAVWVCTVLLVRCGGWCWCLEQNAVRSIDILPSTHTLTP